MRKQSCMRHVYLLPQLILLHLIHGDLGQTGLNIDALKQHQVAVRSKI
jgi:hypothetical protein